MVAKSYGRNNAFLFLTALMLAVFFFSMPVSAFTSQDADTVMNAYNKAFYVVSNGVGNFKKDTTGGDQDFWHEAEMIEVVEDAAERSGSATYKNMVAELYNGFVGKFGSNWTNNKYNDDIMWITIACARAYKLSGNTTHRDQAKYHFDQVYSRGYDTVLGGGIYWTTDKAEKNACINGPAVVAAVLLYEIYNDAAYLTKAKSLYSWLKTNLFDAATGAVYDHKTIDGTLTKWLFSYNQGTFIGAACYLYLKTADVTYLNDAVKAMDYTVNSMCTNGILKDEGTTGDGSGFKGILPRYLKKLIVELGQVKYNTWMQKNANTVFANKRASDTLTYANWGTACPSGTLESFACSTGVALIQCTIPGGSGSPFVQTEAEACNAKSGMVIEACTEGGFQLGGVANATTATYNSLNFSTAGTSFQARVAAATGSGGTIEIRLGSSTGTLAGTCTVASTGGWSTFATVSCTVSAITGTQNVVLVFRTVSGATYVCNMNWFKFTSGAVATSTKTPTPGQTSTPSRTPTSAGTVTPTRSPTPGATSTPTPRFTSTSTSGATFTPVATATSTPAALTDITNLSGTVSSQYTDSPSGEDIAKLIDNSSTTKYLTVHASAWVQFRAGASYVVTKYTLTSANDAAERDPLTWTFQGSANGSTWNTLDSRSGEDFASRYLLKSYTFTNTTAYAYYRLNMTNNSGTMLQLAEWEIFGK